MAGIVKVPYGTTAGSLYAAAVGTIPRAVQLTGTVTTTAPTQPLIVGTATTFDTPGLNRLRANDTLVVDDGGTLRFYEVERVLSDLQLVSKTTPAVFAGRTMYFSRPLYREVVIENTGGANGTVNGEVIEPNQIITFNRDHKLGPYEVPVIRYDATGTTFAITTN